MNKSKMVIKTYQYLDNGKRRLNEQMFEWKTTSTRNGCRNIVYRDQYMKLVQEFGNGRLPSGTTMGVKVIILSDELMKKEKNIYALYRGDELLSIGTLEKIARDMNVSERTILHYGTPAWRERQGANWETSRILIKIDDEEEES